MRYSAILSAALAAAALAGPVAAANSATTSASVVYSDLDLSTPAGQEALDRRIDNAARAACGMDAANTGTRLRSREARRCFDQARTNVHEQVAELIAREKSRG